MNANFSENLAARGVRGDFKFTDPQSLRLFVEGLKGLNAYERSPEPASLNRAETKLKECVDQYPRDILPQFYLGIVKIFQGYPEVKNAIQLFREIAQDVPTLRAAAMYNLAQANIELYTPKAFDDAENWLNKCIKELGGDSSIPSVSLRLQAEVLLLFVQIHKKLWLKRKQSLDTIKDEIEKVEPQLEKELKRLYDKLAANQRIPLKARSEILADYWNNLGLLWEFQAWTANDEHKKKERAQTALNSYAESLKWRLNWIPPKSNMAAVYVQLLQEYDRGIECCADVQRIRPGDDYTEYILGQAWEAKGDFSAAAAHYEKADFSFIPEAKAGLALAYEKLDRKEDAIRFWREILAKRPNDKNAIAAHVRLGIDPTPASGGQHSK